MYISKSEGANFWLFVLTDLQNRGVKDIMIDLKGFPDAIKSVFPNDTALIKLVYLAYRNARKKWTMPVPNWGIISQQLTIKFEDRYNLL